MATAVQVISCFSLGSYISSFSLILPLVFGLVITSSSSLNSVSSSRISLSVQRSHSNKLFPIFSSPPRPFLPPPPPPPFPSPPPLLASVSVVQMAKLLVVITLFKEAAHPADCSFQAGKKKKSENVNVIVIMHCFLVGTLLH